jgi:hypothetical protein
MGISRTPGLIKRGAVWHIQKIFRGTCIRESSSTCDVAKAPEELAAGIEEIRSANV